MDFLVRNIFKFFAKFIRNSIFFLTHAGIKCSKVNYSTKKTNYNNFK